MTKIGNLLNILTPILYLFISVICFGSMALADKELVAKPSLTGVTCFNLFDKSESLPKSDPIRGPNTVEVNLDVGGTFADFVGRSFDWIIRDRKANPERAQQLRAAQQAAREQSERVSAALGEDNVVRVTVSTGRDNAMNRMRPTMLRANNDNSHPFLDQTVNRPGFIEGLVFLKAPNGRLLLIETNGAFFKTDVSGIRITDYLTGAVLVDYTFPRSYYESEAKPGLYVTDKPTEAMESLFAEGIQLIRHPDGSLELAVLSFHGATIFKFRLDWNSRKQNYAIVENGHMPYPLADETQINKMYEEMQVTLNSLRRRGEEVPEISLDFLQQQIWSENGNTSGWGMARFDNPKTKKTEKVYVTNGSGVIMVFDVVRDPALNTTSFAFDRVLVAHAGKTIVENLNSIELVMENNHPYLYANVFRESYTVKIDALTGKVIRKYEFPQVFSQMREADFAMAQNGATSYHDQNGHLILVFTGKRWPVIFEMMVETEK